MGDAPFLFPDMVAESNISIPYFGRIKKVYVKGAHISILVAWKVAF